MIKKPMVNGEYLLKKFPGKGGWTYAEIPEIMQDPTKPFGWVTVSGSVDGYELDRYKLMPMGGGKLFLPLKAAIRKQIGKEAGDYVRIVLEPDSRSYEVPEEIRESVAMAAPEMIPFFDQLKEGEKKRFVDHVNQAGTEETRARRILQFIKELEKGKS